MVKILDNLRHFLILISIIFSIYSLNFYDGSKFVFLSYNLILIITIYYLTNISSSFFSFFLGFYIFMGFWFKYNLSLVFNNGYVFDSGMMNSKDIDGVLILSIYIFLTVLLANFTSKKNNYDKFNIFNKKNIISKIYFRFKYLFIVSFIIFILFTGFINYHYKIYIKGLIFENDLNFIFISLIKWLLLYGLVVLSCFILNQEIRKKNNNHIILITFLIFFEMFVSFTSM